MRSRILVAITLVGVSLQILQAASGAPLTHDAALARAHELQSHMNESRPDPIWASFAPSMRAAMGDSLAFAAMLAGIGNDLGTLEEVISEEVLEQNGALLYRARCRFEKPPEPLQMTIAFAPDGLVLGMNITPKTTVYASTKLDYEQKSELALPFRGEWFVFWGGRTLEQNYHAVSKTQRFAIDLVILEDGTSHSGDGSALTDYYAFGAELLAPGDGTVVEVIDALPDQEIGSSDPQNAYGNVVVIDHGNGEFSVVAHMKSGSARVDAGDRVSEGQVIGLCGNSGNTSEPHIHFQLQDGPDRFDAEGLPVRFRALVVDGRPVTTAEIVKGQRVRPRQ